MGIERMFVNKKENAGWILDRLPFRRKLKSKIGRAVAGLRCESNFLSINLEF